MGPLPPSVILMVIGLFADMTALFCRRSATFGLGPATKVDCKHNSLARRNREITPMRVLPAKHMGTRRAESTPRQGCYNSTEALPKTRAGGPETRRNFVVPFRVCAILRVIANAHFMATYCVIWPRCPDLRPEEYHNLNEKSCCRPAAGAAAEDSERQPLVVVGGYLGRVFWVRHDAG
jgi:hypothetical protein